AKAFGRTTVEAFETLGRVTAKGLQAAGRNLRRVAGAILREGRLVMEGVGEGIGRGVRSLRNLAERLWNRLRFRRFRLTRHGRHVHLWGEINPWILLADGTVEEISFAGTGGRPTLGAAADVAGQRGFLVGIRDADASSFVRHLDSLDEASRRALFQELSAMDE